MTFLETPQARIGCRGAEVQGGSGQQHEYGGYRTQNQRVCRTIARTSVIPGSAQTAPRPLGLGGAVTAYVHVPGPLAACGGA